MGCPGGIGDLGRCPRLSSRTPAAYRFAPKVPGRVAQGIALGTNFRDNSIRERHIHEPCVDVLAAAGLVAVDGDHVLADMQRLLRLV